MSKNRKDKYALLSTIHPKAGDRPTSNRYSDKIFSEKAAPGHIYSASYLPSITGMPAPVYSCVTAACIYDILPYCVVTMYLDIATIKHRFS
jgi:hypothetical protein